MDNHGIRLQISDGSIKIYVRSNKAICDSYMCYSLQHFITPYSDGGTYQNQDLWRLFKLYDCMLDNEERIILNFDFELVNAGEWECAIKITNTPDFHGGYHGYERQKSYYAEINGTKVNLSEETEVWSNKFVFVQNSEIYRQGTKNEVIAYHLKHYTFTEDGLRLHQEIKWAQSLSVEFAYLTMLPIKRTSDDTKNCMQITDSIITNYDNEIYDISSEGHITNISPAINRKKDITYAKIWSDVLGITAQITIMCDLKSTNSFFVQNTKAYNKVYFSYAGNGGKYITKVDEKWEIDSFYNIYRVIPSSP